MKNSLRHSDLPDNLLVRYMLLASGYIDKMEELPRFYRSILKNEGLEALRAELKKPKYAVAERRSFYEIFDSTVLSVFPDFVDEVNAMLEPDHKVSLKSDGSLTTGLRILAAMRLGVSDSSMIASLLRVSVRTVYTYRYTLRRHSFSKELFEEKLRNL